MGAPSWKFELRANESVHFDVNVAGILPNFLTITAVLFQAHTYSNAVRSVGIGSQDSPSKDLLYGCDVGYVVYLENNKSIASCVLMNPSLNSTISGRIWATLLTKTDPIPGGCNLEFAANVYPNLVISKEKEFITAGFASANLAFSRSEGEHRCDDRDLSERLSYTIYGQTFRHMSRAEIVDYLADNAQKKEILLSKIYTLDKNQHKMVKLFDWPSSSVVYSVSVIDAQTENASFYVPSIIEREIFSIPWWLLAFAAFGLIAGILECFVGKLLPVFEQALCGLLVGSIIAWILLRLLQFEKFFDDWSFALTAISAGVLLGAILMLICLKKPMPCGGICIKILLTGFSIASIFNFFLLGSISLIANNFINYVSLFCSIMIIFVVVLLLGDKQASILTSAFLGSFMIVLSLSVMTSGNVHFSIFRAVQKFSNFSLQTLVYSLVPIYTEDICLLSLFVPLMVIGIFVQLRLSGNSYGINWCRSRVGEEQEALLINSSDNSNQYGATQTGRVNAH